MPDLPAGPFPATLPTRVALAGRDADLERVLGSIREGRRLLTITGPGGVGKTGLAVEIGYRLSRTAPGSVLFVPLTFVTEADRVPDAIATAAGWSVGDGMPVVEQIGDRLTDHPTAVIFDNCEQVDAWARVVEWLDAWPATTVIATSRRALGVTAEDVIAIAPLPLADPDAPWREIAANPAVAALVATVRRRVPGYAVSRTNAADLARLCARLDGLPLALEMAAARLHLVNPTELLALLDQRFAVLNVTDSDRPPHHRRLWAAIDWSYQLLDPPTQARFRRLATFVGGFTLDAAAQVWEVDSVAALDTIAALSEHHLVQPLGDRAGASRFEMLESIREFARTQLVEAGELTDAMSRHAEWATQAAQRLQTAISGVEQPHVIATFDAERENFRAALRWQLDTSNPGALALAHGHWQYWHIRGAAREGLRWLHAALELAQPGADEATARALLGAGNLHDSLGELDTAAALCERAVAAFAALGDRMRMASTWHTLAAIARELGDLDRAWQIESDAAAEFEALGDARNHAIALNGLGTIAYRRAQPQEAVTLFRRAADVFEAGGDQLALAHTLDLIGLAEQMLGDPASAVRSHRRAQAIGAELDDLPVTLYAMVNTGVALLATGDDGGATAIHDQALVLATELGDAKSAGHLGALAGAIADHRGEIGAAAGHYANAFKRFVGLGHAVETVAVAERLAALAHELGDAELGARCAAVAAAEQLEPGTVAQQLVDDLASFAAGHVGARRGRAEEQLAELGLTQREAEVCRLVAARRTDQEIADELFVAVRTASTHVSAVLRKLGVPSRRDVAERLNQLGVSLGSGPGG